MLSQNFHTKVCLFFLSFSFYVCAGQSTITETRLDNISLMRNALHEGEYNGYDIIIISSTSDEEADFQQRMLEKAFSGTSNKNGREPIILSVVDTTEGGQLIGSVFTWLRAERMMYEKHPDLLNGYPSLLSYIKSCGLKAAAFHNGGKGERCSPLTQSLGNSRGAQKLVGSVINAKGENIHLDILLSVVLQCSSFAVTNQGTHFDTYWTSQIAFGSYPHDKLLRSNFGLDKFLVGFDKNNLIAQNIADFGTASLDEDGRMTAFYGNKRFASRVGTEYVVDKEKITRELFNKGTKVAYDFGSFAICLDMWEILIDYWNNKCQLQRTNSRCALKRDIDPHFIQPFLRFLHALSDLSCGESIDSTFTSTQEFDQFLKETMPAVHAYIWEDVLHEKDPKKKAEAITCMEEVMDFYLMYSNNPCFANLKKVFGHIDLGDETQWFRYRRPIDIMNEKLEMLSDIIGCQIEVQLDGTIRAIQVDEKVSQRSREARLMRGIDDHAIVDFVMEGRKVTLSVAELKEGIWTNGIYVRNSIIQNSDLAQGSVIIDSVVNNVSGKVIAIHSYLESSRAPLIAVTTSIVHQCVDGKPITGDKEVISDVYRTKLSPPYHGRMRAPIGYDPKGMPIGSIRDFIQKLPYDLTGVTEFSDKTARTEDGHFTFDEIREIEPIKTADNQFRESLYIP